MTRIFVEDKGLISEERRNEAVSRILLSGAKHCPALYSYLTI